LLDIGSAIATPLSSSKAHQIARAAFDASSIEGLERSIDAMDGALPALSNFILPGGGLAAGALHVARTVARRAERHIVPLVDREDVDAAVLRYANRLSDWLFTAARVAAAHAKRPDEIYRKKQSSSNTNPNATASATAAAPGGAAAAAAPAAAAAASPRS
jgi:cob(I)alamin adenosyltransferase